ncbi:MAG: GNAT family N-acetyltransferase [Ruminococcaceae bacterium]|nr:GNAT family N-acetyltransferase [Oscillospiraceae bacterium]
MLIERAQKGDLAEILALQYLAYQSEARLFDDPDIPPLKQTLEEVEAEYERGVILKATDDGGAIIGSVRAHRGNGTVYIGKLMVHPDRQRKGIGSALLEAMEREFPGQRYELFTSTRSVGNIRLYQRTGYRAFREEQISGDLCFVYMEKNPKSE